MKTTAQSPDMDSDKVFQMLINGTSNNDTLAGTPLADQIYSGGGNDTVNAGSGNDDVYGGDGGDTLNGQDGDDRVYGGGGKDTIDGGNDRDLIYGGDEDDKLSGSAGNDTLYGDSGKDTLDGGDGHDSLFGGDGDNSLTGSAGDDSLLGGSSKDALYGGTGLDTLAGGDGDDTLYGGDGADVIDGTQGQDKVYGGEGNDLLAGGDGDDQIEGADGADSMDGGQGQDKLYAGEGADSLTGGVGDDKLYGGAGADRMDGGGDNDFEEGGDGNDTLIGGAGVDQLYGGNDADLFLGPYGPGSGDFVDGGEGGVDNDTLNMAGAGPYKVVYAHNTHENGRIEYLDSRGNTTGSLNFVNIDRVVPCFTPGTLIVSARGEVPVENLRAGDRIITRDNGMQEIRWVGRRDLSWADLTAAPHLKPILIRQGSLGNGLPERDMMVSPNHRVLVANDRTALYFDEREVLVAAKHLAAGKGVHSVDAAGASYIHFMFDRHEVVLSNGAWTESFQPGDLTLKGMGNAQRSEIYDLFPELKTDAGVDSYTAARRTLKRHEAALIAK